MKKIISIIALFGLLVCVSCTHNSEPKIIHNAVKDYDGNQYDAVRIGRHTWMKTNLRTTHYDDGTPIPAGIGEDVRTPAYCEIPGVDAASYGLLYNWYAVMHNDGNPGNQGICPKGWRVPSTDEWRVLVSNVSPYYNGDYSNVSASALASQVGWEYYPPINMDSLHHAYDSLALIYEWDFPWESSNEYYEASMIMNSHAYTPGANLSQNNTSGFSAVPAGLAGWEPSELGKSAFFWTSSESNMGLEYAMSVYMYYKNPSVDVPSDDYYMYSGTGKTYGLSVRCVKN